MAFYQARSGVCRSGVTYAGWTAPNIQLTINGTDRSSNVLYENFTLTQHADGTPSTLTFTLKNLTPTVGQDIGLLFTTPNDYLFAGTLLQVEAITETVTKTGTTGGLLWHCVAVGYQWLLDRYDRVLASYLSTGVGTMVADLLARFTNGGFRVGYIPASLGNLDMTFTFETVTGALNRIAKAANAFWAVEPLDGVSRIVNVYDVYPQAAPATVTEAAIIATSLNYRQDLTQVRTRTMFQGWGSAVSVPTSAGSSVIQVDNLEPFTASGGLAITGRSLITYTGYLLTQGLGFLTGVSGLLDDLALGDSINLIVTTVDAAATTALATRLGGGLSGQATNYLADGRLSATEATRRGTTDLAIFGAPLDETTWTYKAAQRWLRVGQSVTVALTQPLTISGTFLIQTVIWKPYKNFGGVNTDVFQTVEASRYVRSMTDLLAQLPG